MNLRGLLNFPSVGVDINYWSAGAPARSSILIDPSFETTEERESVNFVLTINQHSLLFKVTLCLVQYHAETRPLSTRA